MFLGDGGGNLRLPGQAFKTGKRPYQRLRSADFNKDGKPDVVTTDLDQNAVTILLGDGKGGLRDAPGSPFPAGRAPWAVAIDDMNGDGNLDLVIVPYAPDVPDPKDVGVTVLLGDGKGGFRKMPGSPFSLAGCEGPDRVATGDINGDGLRDIVVTCGQNNRLMLYLGSREAVSSSPLKAFRPDGLALPSPTSKDVAKTTSSSPTACWTISPSPLEGPSRSFRASESEEFTEFHLLRSGSERVRRERSCAP